MATRWIDRFSVVLLDMNGTFMFGHDRFGPEEDYHRTYRAVGGRSLNRVQVTTIMSATCDALLASYDNPDRFDDYPSLSAAFAEFGKAPADEVPLLERAFAAHELGYVPAEHEACLRALAETHHLGIVSNICARPDPWLDALGRSGLRHLFKTLVFSSEGRSIKPSPAVFRRAMEGLPPDSTILFVGDDLERDIVPAKARGWGTAWIAPAGSEHPDADAVVPSLPALLSA